MHVNGNRFVLAEVDGPIDSFSPTMGIAAVRRLGFDQFLFFNQRAKPGDYHYRIFNRDGSESQQCGNGALCVGRYVSSRLGCQSVTLHTRSHTIQVESYFGHSTAHLGVAQLMSDERHPFQGYRLAIYHIGNRHVVVPVSDVEAIDLQAIYLALSRRIAWPFNLEVYALSQGRVTVRIYENGVGETQACGSGLCCVAADIFNQHKTIQKIALTTRGGCSVVEQSNGGGLSLTALPERI
ncbi:MAG: diaminopimelate epimerase [Legionellales bacterium]|nr:diaminopimelate epimerase [Legionellales bacterium]|tara:strand:+ start:838 stop:1551 length:714 start_codon:yes stop_codon:yes gene_type:complete